MYDFQQDNSPPPLQNPYRWMGLIVLCLSSIGWTQRPTTQVVRIEEAPVLDGRLIEACWQGDPVLTDFTQIEPIEGAEPTERTEVRFRYTNRRLYIGVRCFDSDPREIRATQMQHDGDLGADDLILIAFDTFDRKRDGYYFAVNPAGARVEGLVENFYEKDKSWDTIWEAKTRIDSQGWTAEIAIPFNSFSFDPQSDQWGCNVTRVIRRKQESLRWTVLSVAKSSTLLAEFGALQGFEDINQGVGLEVKPFVRIKYRETTDGSEEGWDTKPGGDVTYYITPSLKVNGTVNTDFAEADVDDRQVNLTRFPLFFPEKRDFFLQDSSLFSIGGLNHTLLPYYSRRIGLSADGQPVDIRHGGRLTGRTNGTGLAFQGVEQEGYEGVDPSNAVGFEYIYRWHNLLRNL
ncbi:MAG: carbohydrate binding family 9 domain-containing protein, partial [Bacteroidales bacterium]|nr:carbohydrate binding family 9 domain-containing protein [Bacteroidales bacterium]